MALPVTFASLSAGNQSLSLIDTQSAALGAVGVIPCAAAGTNAIALTPAANTPVVLSYTDLAPSFQFAAAATSSGAVTINVAGLGARNAYKWNGAQIIGNGDLISGLVYKATFLTALNGGAGGFAVDAIGVGNNFFTIDFIIDGGGVAITTGVKGFLGPVLFGGTITNWSLMADQSGSIVVDILRTNNGVPVTSMVGGGTKPTLSSAQTALGITPSGWTSTTINVTDWLGFQVTSAATVTRVTVALQGLKI